MWSCNEDVHQILGQQRSCTSTRMGQLSWKIQLKTLVVAAGANPVQITRGIEKTTKALVAELKLMSKEVEDSYGTR
ncbi:hypothetical protein MKW94_026897 [Papaver nudicaule]|uniref:Uncharacterized protein n=1 Tax=Papaver nudicaule TaxID=74823 RepID=A0AA41UVG7_PAPNU|nr:hypothetical protein [Papaver nudicaule]